MVRFGPWVPGARRTSERDDPMKTSVATLSRRPPKDAATTSSLSTFCES